MRHDALSGATRRLLGVAVAVALAVLPFGCAGLDPGVYGEGGGARPASTRPAARTFAKPQPASQSLRLPPKGRWSDDGLRYEEAEATTGIPWSPFPLGRTTTTGGGNPVHYGIDGVNINKTRGHGK